MKATFTAAVAVGLALTAALALAFVPLERRCTRVLDADGGPATKTCREVSIVEDQGGSVAIAVAVPVVISMVPLLVRRRGARLVAAILLWACCVVAILSVGILFVPTAVTMTVASVMRDRDLASTRSTSPAVH